MAGEDGGGGSLLAISDLHVGHPGNRAVVEGLRPESPDDWLIVAGDVGDTVADVEWALRLLGDRFAGWSGRPATTSCGRRRPTR
jgi:3',5'-cyclic AMP phosphodiesterase CpdA